MATGAAPRRPPSLRAVARKRGHARVVRLSPLHAMHRAHSRRLALVRSGRPQPVCRGRLRVLRPGDGFASTFATADPHADAPPLGSLAASGFGRHPPATAHRLHGPSRRRVHGAARSCGLRRETAPSRRLRSPARAARYPWAVGSRARLRLESGCPGCVGGGWRRSTLAASAAGPGACVAKQTACGGSVLRRGEGGEGRGGEGSAPRTPLCTPPVPPPPPHPSYHTYFSRFLTTSSLLD